MFADKGHKLYSIHSKQKPAIKYWGISGTGEGGILALVSIVQFDFITITFQCLGYLGFFKREIKEAWT